MILVLLEIWINLIWFVLILYSFRMLLMCITMFPEKLSGFIQEVLLEVIGIIQEERAALMRFDCFWELDNKNILMRRISDHIFEYFWCVPFGGSTTTFATLRSGAQFSCLIWITKPGRVWLKSWLVRLVWKLDIGMLVPRGLLHISKRSLWCHICTHLETILFIFIIIYIYIYLSFRFIWTIDIWFQYTYFIHAWRAYMICWSWVFDFACAQMKCAEFLAAVLFASPGA